MNNSAHQDLEELVFIKILNNFFEFGKELVLKNIRSSRVVTRSMVRALRLRRVAETLNNGVMQDC